MKLAAEIIVGSGLGFRIQNSVFGLDSLDSLVFVCVCVGHAYV